MAPDGENNAGRGKRALRGPSETTVRNEATEARGHLLVQSSDGARVLYAGKETFLPEAWHL